MNFHGCDMNHDVTVMSLRCHRQNFHSTTCYVPDFFPLAELLPDTAAPVDRYCTTQHTRSDPSSVCLSKICLFVF